MESSDLREGIAFQLLFARREWTECIRNGGTFLPLSFLSSHIRYFLSFRLLHHLGVYCVTNWDNGQEGWALKRAQSYIFLLSHLIPRHLLPNPFTLKPLCPCPQSLLVSCLTAISMATRSTVHCSLSTVYCPLFCVSDRHGEDRETVYWLDFVIDDCCFSVGVLLIANTDTHSTQHTKGKEGRIYSVCSFSSKWPGRHCTRCFCLPPPPPRVAPIRIDANKCLALLFLERTGSCCLSLPLSPSLSISSANVVITRVSVWAGVFVH